MSTFIGKYEAKADVKGRIFIPSVYRKLLPDGERERIVMHRDSENDCLILYPEHVWNHKVAQLKSTLDEWNPTDQLILMQFISAAEWLDIDAQGRVLIAKKHLQSIAVENQEILFVGMIDRFAVWGKTRFEQTLIPQTDFAKLLKEKMMKSTLKSEEKI
ncbi:MAG: cell division/cell wall cluster transcriptional repressor MraZ [Paludibacter sp.]|nr:cell division/cell wall cluster transcriptional repressor MraZ [Paludibacter sp.]